MPNIKILTETELRSHVSLDLQAVKCVEEAFAALAGGSVEMPPILHLNIPEFNGEVDVKTAYVPGVDSFAIKISPGFFENPKIGLPSVNGLMVLFSAKTGILEAVLLDNGYLTDVRTAAAGSVAAKYLSREDSKSAGIIGGGVQARLQLEALKLVRPIETAKIWARNAKQAAKAAKELKKSLKIEVEAVETAEEAVEGSDIVVTTTPATEPLVMADWLQPGQHVTAMGSDNTLKNELEPAALSKADLFVCDRQSQCATLGELHHALEAEEMERGAWFPELGEIVSGLKPGRENADQLTVCDLTGTGVQDTAIATLARQVCAENEAGTDFES